MLPIVGGASLLSIADGGSVLLDLDGFEAGDDRMNGSVTYGDFDEAAHRSRRAAAAARRRRVPVFDGPLVFTSMMPSTFGEACRDALVGGRRADGDPLVDLLTDNVTTLDEAFQVCRRRVPPCAAGDELLLYRDHREPYETVRDALVRRFVGSHGHPSEGKDLS